MRLKRAILASALVVIAIVIAAALCGTWNPARTAWLQNAINAAQACSPPSSSDLEAASQRNWTTDKYLIFSNGWAAFTMHTAHRPGERWDAAVLMTSDGRLFRSFEHMCKGIGWRVESCPSDFDAYLKSYGKEEHWKQVRSAQPAGAANRSQPVSPQTNRPSAAAGSGR